MDGSSDESFSETNYSNTTSEIDSSKLSEYDTTYNSNISNNLTFEKNELINEKQKKITISKKKITIFCCLMFFFIFILFFVIIILSVMLFFSKKKLNSEKEYNLTFVDVTNDETVKGKCEIEGEFEDNSFLMFDEQRHLSLFLNNDVNNNNVEPEKLEYSCSGECCGEEEIEENGNRRNPICAPVGSMVWAASSAIAVYLFKELYVFVCHEFHRLRCDHSRDENWTWLCNTLCSHEGQFDEPYETIDKHELMYNFIGCNVYGVPDRLTAVKKATEILKRKCYNLKAHDDTYFIGPVECAAL